MNHQERSRLLTVPAWPRHHAWPTERAMRHYIRRANANGLSPAIHRVGRRVLIDEAEFFSWARARTKTGAKA
jgi:hypothetical protein